MRSKLGKLFPPLTDPKKLHLEKQRETYNGTTHQFFKKLRTSSESITTKTPTNLPNAGRQPVKKRNSQMIDKSVSDGSSMRTGIRKNRFNTSNDVASTSEAQSSMMTESCLDS